MTFRMKKHAFFILSNVPDYIITIYDSYDDSMTIKTPHLSCYPIKPATLSDINHGFFPPHASAISKHTTLRKTLVGGRAK